MNKFAYVGCRTSEWRGARGKGIEVFRIDESGNWHNVQRVISVQENPPGSLWMRNGTDCMCCMEMAVRWPYLRVILSRAC